MSRLRTRLQNLERRLPESPYRLGPQTFVGPCTRYSIEQPRLWKPGDPQIFAGLDDWLAGRLPAPPPGMTPLFLPPQARLIAVGYVDRPDLPNDWHVEADDCRCMACAGWPASAHVASEDLLCMCDACQEEFDPPEYRQWLRIAESRHQLLGWSCKPPAPPGIAPWLFGFAASVS